MTEGAVVASDALRVAILTVSDRASAGTYTDKSGPALGALVQSALGAEVVAMEIVPDEREVIAARLCGWTDDLNVDLILTTGGTGFAPRDITPEATADVIDRAAPGLAEAMRAASLKATPYAALSRATAGIRERTLIINLPGSPKGAIENLRAILPILPHAIALIRDETSAYSHHQFGYRATI